MSKVRKEKLPEPVAAAVPGYEQVLGGVVQLLEQARRASARAVNAFITATYWDIGRRIVEFEQGGEGRAQYGQGLLQRLSPDLTARFGRGFGVDNLQRMRLFYRIWPADKIYATLVRKSLLVANRQLERQITTLFYERTVASRNKGAMLKKGAIAKPGEDLSPEEEIKDPFVLEFLSLKDEYSESDLEEGLIRELETFLLELGGDFAFVGRQKRLRIGDEWYRLDLLFFHRKLRCLVVIDLKLGKFTHADAGQMHPYLTYARAHWTNEGENPPVGVILCTQKDSAVVHYALENLPNKVLAAEYRTTLPDENTLAAELESKRRLLESRTKPRKGGQ